MIAKDSWSAQTKDPSRSWQTRCFGTDFDDPEGFSTVCGTKSFMIMVGRMRGTDDAGSVVIERRMMLA
jgi:hypothetical protein